MTTPIKELQILDLSDQKAEIERLRNEMRKRSSPFQATESMEFLQADHDELRLYLAAVVRILVSKGVIRPEELKQVVDVIDAEDGSADGRFTGPIS